MNMVMGSNTPSPVPQNGYRKPDEEKVFQMFTDILLVVMLETTETTGVKQELE